MKTFITLYSFLVLAFLSFGSELNVQENVLHKSHKVEGLPLVNTDQLEHQKNRISAKNIELLSFIPSLMILKIKLIGFETLSYQYRTSYKNNYLYLHSGLSPPYALS